MESALQELKPDVTQITSGRSLLLLFFVGFCLVLPFRKEGFHCFYKLSTHKTLYFFKSQPKDYSS